MGFAQIALLLPVLELGFDDFRMGYLATVFQFLADSQKSLCFLVGALRGRVFTLSREVTVVCLRHRDCQTAQSNFGLGPGDRLPGRRSTVVGEGLQGEVLMHVS